MSDEIVQTKRKGAATRDYVDASIDSQRQYAETLFSKAENRVKAMLDQMFEERMSKALATIRPATVVESPKPAISLREMSQRAIDELTEKTLRAVESYQMTSGLQVRYLVVSRDNHGYQTVKAIVANI